jgi:nucleoside-diphosphate-sugar epimerase
MSFEVVVTGASGFIGKALLSQLKLNNISAIGLSRKGGYGLKKVSSYLGWEPGVNTVLVHLAQPNNVSNASEGNELTLCKALSEKPWAHIVYVSSSVVYGDKELFPHKPDEKILPICEYAKVKLACENIIMGVGGTCLRFANIYGSGMAKNSVISDIITQIPGIDPLIVKNERPIRDFLWIDDATRCLMQATLLRRGGIFNVGSGTGISIGEIATLSLNLAGENDRLVISESLTQGISCLVLDISDTLKKLNWSPEINISKGLSNLIHTSQTNG